MAKNQLQFTYYAFSDDGIDYSGSLLSTNSNFTASIDNVVFRNLSFENFAKKDQDLSSFLYTVKTDNKKIPQLIVSISTGSLLELKRHYSTVDIVDYGLPDLLINNTPLDIVIKADVEESHRTSNYVIQQNVLPYIKKVFDTK